MRFEGGGAAELLASLLAGLAPVLALPRGELLHPWTPAALAAAALAFAPLHELLHAAAARALGCRRIAVKPFALGFATLFLDPLPAGRASLVYLAPLLAAPAVSLPLALAGLPSAYALLWVSMCAGDVAALLRLLAERPAYVVCSPDGRALALR